MQKSIRSMSPAATGKPTPSARPSASRAVQTNAIKLYTNPGSRGKITEWYLSELDMPYEQVVVDMRKGEHKAAWFLDINPFGKVPAFEDDGVKLFESGAILLHLAMKYGKMEQSALSKATQWTLFANSTLCDAFFNERMRASQMPVMLSTLDGLLTKSQYLEGNDFSVGDIAVGSYLLYLPLFFPDLDLTKYPNVWAYMKRVAERPSCPAPYKESLAGAIQRWEGSSSGGLGDLLKKFGGK